MVTVVQYNFTLDDTSPIFQYSPPSDESDASKGWTIAHNAGTRSTYHTTRMANASLSFSFHGTGVTLFGSSNASYEAYLDGQNAPLPSSDENTLFQSNCSELREYQVYLKVLSATENQVLQFDYATLTSNVLGRSRYPEISMHSDDDVMKAHGTWHRKNQNNRFPLISNPNVTVRATNSPGDNMSFSVRGRAVAIYGPVNASSGLFSVMQENDDHVVTASSSTPINETVLFYKDGLSESNTTTLHLTNLGNGETTFCVSRVQVFAFNSTNGTSSAWTSSSTARSHRTALIGAIVGSIIGVVILAAIIVISMKRRNLTTSEPNAITPFEVGTEETSNAISRSGSKDSSSLGSEPNAITPFEVGTEETSNAITRSGSKDSSSLELNQDESLRIVIPDSIGARPAVSSISLLTVERLLLLIARQVDGVTRTGEASGDQDRRSLPPYPASMRNRSYRAAS
ncbi:hypothetical protein A7U60_g8246 [Sanghuangporus baumii]|uniref:Transmembrane protein n=1 Tax=Sanghuangporus baumii TaxID=108892 RepID=A0A9Q5MYT6_SANBA|nr:hypothetical protein A7U60_g8246 [Sanghuangporus baumii]